MQSLAEVEVRTPAPSGDLAGRLGGAGRIVAVTGVVLPLSLIGVLKFTPTEVEALKPLISATPWLAWLYPLFGYEGASYFLGVVELVTAALFVAAFRDARAAVAAGALGVLTFGLTCSTMLAVPIWEPAEGGLPFLNASGAFLIKDVALLGVSLAVLGDGLRRSGMR